MVTLTLRCPFCDSDALIKYGFTPNGKQRYRCRSCGRQHWAHPAPNGYTPEQREVILRAYQARSSLRGLSRTFGVSRNTVSSWLKKSPELAATGEHPAAPQPAETLELDELWTFVGRRRGGAIGLWPALCPGTPAGRTRQVVAFALGPRSDATARQLWSHIPETYRHATLDTDPLEGYHHVFPSAQHRASYKGSGQTNHLERFNGAALRNTLRQRLGRRVRKTLSFSRCDRMLALTTRLFLQRYNTKIQIQYQG